MKGQAGFQTIECPNCKGVDLVMVDGFMQIGKTDMYTLKKPSNPPIVICPCSPEGERMEVTSNIMYREIEYN